MPIESLTYINGLDPTNPVVGDPLGTADDHLRLIKAAIKATFPNVTGVITSTHTDLSSLPTLTSRVTAVEANRLRNDVDGTSTGSLTISGSGKFLDAPTVKQGGHVLVPTGGIIIWWGTPANVPAGWALCDGTAGTPDLRDRFVLGASTGVPAHTTGGSTTISVTSAAGGDHNHTGSSGVAGDHTHSGTANSAGGHDHGGVGGATALTVDQIPSHTHQEFVGQGGGGGDTTWNIGTGGTPSGTSLNTGAVGGGQAHSHGISATPDHVHGLSLSTASGHAHTINASGTHTHGVTASGHRPPFYSLAFIMKL